MTFQKNFNNEFSQMTKWTLNLHFLEKLPLNIDELTFNLKFL